MKCRFLIALALLLVLFSKGGSLTNGIVARLNGRTVRVLNLQVNYEWSNYCHYYQQSSTSLRRMLSVTCCSLGYEDMTNGSDSAVSYGTSISTNYRHYYIYCQGNERTLKDCLVSYSGYYSSCRYYYQVTCLPCRIGAVRLVGGLIPEMGHFEVCRNGLWTRICYSSNNQNSAVVCRQLNFPVTKSIDFRASTTNSIYNLGYVKFNERYNCYGSESQVTDCTTTTTYCSSSNSAIHCKGDQVQNCNSGNIRLHEGKDEFEGQLQICNNRIWEGVSYSYYWNYYDAQVACRQLWLLQANTKIAWTSLYSTATPISRAGYRCTGSELRIQDCPSYIINYYSSVVYLRCQPVSSGERCVHGNVRLVGGPQPSEGRVEICYQGRWGSICRNGWDRNEAAIVCGQLGYQTENATAIYTSQYGDGNRPFLLSDLRCNKENNLLECPRSYYYYGYHTCRLGNGQTAAVKCDTQMCSHGDVRLYGGYVHFEGVPEVCINGQWTYSCNQHWDSNYNMAFCRQILGHQNISAMQSNNGYLRQYPYSRLSLHNITCRNLFITPNFIRDCQFTTSNVSCSSVKLGCYVYSNCVNGTIRLIGGRFPNTGVVEICLDGVWGSITPSSWDYRDARVACKELGQPWERSISTRGLKLSPFFIRSVYCTGHETALLDCRYYIRYYLSSTSFYNSLNSYGSIYAAGVICNGNGSNTNNSCGESNLRLTNISQNVKTIKGRVEICDNGDWVAICHSSSWGLQHTKLVCMQQLGYTPKAYWFIQGGEFGRLASNVYCPNNIENISSCSLSYTSCYTTATVGVLCQDIAYEISITSSESTGVFELGSTATFNCSVSPDPVTFDETAILRYRWIVNGYFSYSYSTSSTYSLYVNPRYTTNNFIYCQVLVNYVSLGSGHYLIKVKDAIDMDIQNSTESANTTITLTANITNSGLFDGVMKDLAWYYNDNPISIASNLSYPERLASISVPFSDRGIYKVRLEGLLLVPHDQVCERSLLDALWNYPAFRFVQFNNIHYAAENNYNHPLVSIKSNFGSSKFIQFTSNEQVYATVTVDLSDVCNHYLGKQFALEIYNNRQSTIYYQSIYKKQNFRTTILISDGLYSNDGMYEVFLYTFYNQEFISNCSSYYNFIWRSPWSITRIILEKKYLQLLYYENVSHVFSTNKFQHYMAEKVTLTCVGTIGLPHFTSISITKENATLNRSDESTVHFYATFNRNNQYGVYSCIMNASGATFVKDMFIKNKVDFTLQLNYEGSGTTCEEDSITTDNIIGAFTLLLRERCNCNVTNTDFDNSSIQCDSKSNLASLNTTLTYSSATGDVIAFDIAQKIYAEASTGSELKMRNDVVIESIKYSSGNIQSTEFKLSRQQLSTAGISVGSFLGGVIFAVFFIGVASAVLYFMRKRKSGKDLEEFPRVMNVSEVDGNYSTSPSLKVDTIRKGQKVPMDYEDPITRPNKNSVAVPSKCGNVSMEVEPPLYESVENMEADIKIIPNIGYGGVKFTEMSRL